MTDTKRLSRIMGPFGGLMITLAALSPSLGVFVVGNDILHQAGSGTIICILAAAVLGLGVATLYAELGSAFPHAGAEYTIAGRILGPRAGFIMLAVNLIGLPIGMAISGLGIADYLQDLLPGLVPRGVALFAVFAAVSIAGCSIRMNATFTGILVAAEILALAVTASLGLLHTAPDGLHRLLHPAMALATGGVGPVPFGTLAVTVAAGVYAINGYGGVISFGEEIENPQRAVARVVYWALGIGAAVVIVPMACVIAAAPDPEALYRAPSPIIRFLRAAGGPTVALLISVSVAGAIFNCMVAVALTLGRNLFAAARDGGLPGPLNQAFARLSKRFQSPARATLAGGAIGAALCFVPLKALILINGNLAVATYTTLAAAVIVGRRNGRTAHSQAKTPAHPIAPLWVLAGTAGLIAADLADPVNGRPALVATVAIALLGVVYAAYITRRKAGWSHQAATIDPLPK